MNTTGSQVVALGSGHAATLGLRVRSTGFDTTAKTEASQLSLGSVPPRALGPPGTRAGGGAAKSLPKPIQMVPVPLPVTPGIWIPCAAFTCAVVKLPFALGL